MNMEIVKVKDTGWHTHSLIIDGVDCGHGNLKECTDLYNEIMEDKNKGYIIKQAFIELNI